LPAGRLLGVHQDPMRAPLLAVEIFHPQLLAAARVGGKFAHAAEQVAVFAHIEFETAQGPPAPAQQRCKVPHRRKKQGDALLGRPDMGRFFGDLGHEDAVAPEIETIECRGIGVELVTAHEQQLARPP
jgi:hypothetical protein